jgi:hypothetical protein
MISAEIRAELASLQTQVSAAKPLRNATRATIQALQLNATQLVADVEAALVAPGNMLDTWTAPADPAVIISGIADILTAAQDQSALSLMRGVIGRATSNLEQL